MESRENPVFGRKIFFLNPSLRIQNTIVNRLRQEEYEVYTISDYKDGKPILSENETAICFVNIDGQLSFKQWFNFLHSFQNDSTLKSVILGALSMDAKPADIEQFVMKLCLPAGFVNLKDSSVLVYSNIQKILDLNGAKGRRQYVRLDCYGLEHLTANCLLNNRLVDFVLADLSSVGFAARCPKKFAVLFKKGLRYTLTLHIDRKDYLVKADVFAIKENEEDSTIVFMLSLEPESSIRDEIRIFVFKMLQKQMDALLNSSIKDMTNYSLDCSAGSSSKQPGDYDTYHEIGDLEPL